MKGYLNNLTMRTLNEGSLVEPRLPSLFEPNVFETRPASPEEIMTVSEAAPSPAKAADRVSDSHSPPATKSEPEREAEHVVQENRTFEQEEVVESFSQQVDPVVHEEKREEQVESLTVRPAIQLRRTATETETQTEVDESFVQNDLTVNMEESPGPLTENTGVWPLPAPPVASRFPASPPTQTRRPRQDRSQTEIAPATDETFTPPIRTPETKTIVTPATETALTEELIDESSVTEKPEDFQAVKAFVKRANPTPAIWRDAQQQSSRGRRRQPFAAIEAEPSINVTIGRVEVRAVPADNRKTTSPRRSESPVMPLEDYLRKQRRGGER